MAINSRPGARGNSATKDIRTAEVERERAMSQVIGKMPLLWLSIGDEPGPDSLHGKIERNSIALLSNFNKAPLDLSSHALAWATALRKSSISLSSCRTA